MEIQYEYLTRNVKLYYGTEASLPSGWYVFKGQTLNTKIYGNITLPDLRDTFPRAGTYSNTNTAESVGTSKWTWGSSETHYHDFNATSGNLSGGGHTHTWSSSGANNVSRTRGTVNSITVYPQGIDVKLGSANIEWDTQSSFNLDKTVKAGTVATNNSSHSHTTNIPYSSFPNNGSTAGAHNHNINFTNNSNAGVLPATISFLPIVYLGALA